MVIRVLESATEDLRAGHWFYEEQSPGLGDYFIDSISADVQSLQIYAGIHIQLDGDFRMLAKRFPFAIYYCLEGDDVAVFAILDCRRNPKWIVTKLSRSRSRRNPPES